MLPGTYPVDSRGSAFCVGLPKLLSNPNNGVPFEDYTKYKLYFIILIKSAFML